MGGDGGGGDDDGVEDVQLQEEEDIPPSLYGALEEGGTSLSCFCFLFAYALPHCHGWME